MSAENSGRWTSTVTAGMFIVVTVVVVLLFSGILVPLAVTGNLTLPRIIVLVLLFAVIVLVITFTSVRVTVDADGLRVVSRLTRIPLKRIPVERMTAVEVVDLKPYEWGGWGYRVQSGRRAVVLREGPAILVTIDDGKKFAVTVKDPDEPVALLRSLAGLDGVS